MRLGLQAASAGQTAAARQHFLAALHHEPNNIPALLWLAYLSPTPENSQRLLQQVLVIDPDNERARAGLQWLAQQRGHGASSRPAPAGGEQPHPADTELDGDAALEALQRKLGTKDLPTQASKGPSAQRARRRINPFLLVLLLWSGLAAGALLLGLAVFRPVTLLAALQPTATATLVPTLPPTPTATWTPVPSPTATPVPTETPLPSPTATAVVVETPAPTAVPAAGAAHRPADLVPGEKWIEVNLTLQLVTAWEDTVPVMTFSASTGLANTPTVVGQYRIYQKLVSTRMVGPGYDLPNVPHTMYFYAGYALHGAYWHNNFGQPMSHGCVNLSPENAERLFAWADPVVPAGVHYVNATSDNPGTRVVVHY